MRANVFLEPNVKSRHVTHEVKQLERSECTGGRPEGLGLTVSSARPLWKLPTESNSYLLSLPVGLGCPTGSRKQLKYINPHSESHELNTAKAWWRCLTPSLATGQRPLASAHSNTLPRTGILPEYLAGTRYPTV